MSIFIDTKIVTFGTFAVLFFYFLPIHLDINQKACYKT